MRLANGTLWPIPITLPVADDAPVQAGASVALRNSKNELLAVMRVAEVYPWNLEREAIAVAGKNDPRHPLVAEMAGWGKRYVAGPLHVVNLPRYYDFAELRLTPAQVRARLTEMGSPNCTCCVAGAGNTAPRPEQPGSTRRKLICPAGSSRWRTAFPKPTATT